MPTERSRFECKDSKVQAFDVQASGSPDRRQPEARVDAAKPVVDVELTVEPAQSDVAAAGRLIPTPDPVILQRVFSCLKMMHEQSARDQHDGGNTLVPSQHPLLFRE